MTSSKYYLLIKFLHLSKEELNYIYQNVHCSKFDNGFSSSEKNCEVLFCKNKNILETLLMLILLCGVNPDCFKNHLLVYMTI